MPKAEFCPVCKQRLKRMYEREREGLYGARSKYFWGYLWICPDNHVVIVNPKGSETQTTYELKVIAIANA